MSKYELLEVILFAIGAVSFIYGLVWLLWYTIMWIPVQPWSGVLIFTGLALCAVSYLIEEYLVNTIHND